MVAQELGAPGRRDWRRGSPGGDGWGTVDSGPGLQAPTLTPRRALLFLHRERVPGRRGRWGEACTGGRGCPEVFAAGLWVRLRV